jgi:type II secretory pathway component PulF
MDIKNPKQGPQAQKISKVGIFLAVCGFPIGIVVILMVVVVPIFKEAYELNVRLSAFTEFVLETSDTIRLHVDVAVCVALAFLVASLATIHRARLRLYNSPI